MLIVELNYQHYFYLFVNVNGMPSVVQLHDHIKFCSIMFMILLLGFVLFCELILYYFSLSLIC